MLEWCVWSPSFERWERTKPEHRICVSSSSVQWSVHGDRPVQNSSCLGRRTGLLSLGTSGCNATAKAISLFWSSLLYLHSIPVRRMTLSNSLAASLVHSRADRNSPGTRQFSLILFILALSLAFILCFPAVISFWSIYLRVLGILCLWVVHDRTASSLGQCCQPQRSCLPPARQASAYKF